MLLRLAWRSLWRNRRRTFITVSSIGFGLALAILSIAMGEGVYSRLIDMVVRLQAGHITLEDSGYREAPAVDMWVSVSHQTRSLINSWPEVESTKALILGQGVAKSGAGATGAFLMGVEPSIEIKTSPVVKNMISGQYLDDEDLAMVVVGNELAEHLNLKVGKKMVIATNDVNGNLVEELCRVKGIFHTGSQEIDACFVQAPLAYASNLFQLPQGGITQLGIVLKDSGDQKRTIRRIRRAIESPGPSVLPWQDVMPELSSYIKMDKGSNWIFQGILLFIILFTIFNTILMSVLERQREFAVLLAIGSDPWILRKQIFLESALLGLIGCCVGVTLGFVLGSLLNMAQIDLGSLVNEGFTVSGFAVSMMLYAKMSWEVCLIPAAIVFVSVLLLSLFPMQRAANTPIAGLLR